MIRDFNNAKNVVGYLERRYGKIRNHTIGDDIRLIKSISDDHSLDQISMMKNRINASISSSRDTSYVNNNPVNFLTVLFTVMCTLFFGFITIGSQLVLAYMGHVVNINKEEITLKDLNNMVDSFDLSSLMDVALFPIVVIFFLIYTTIVLVNSILKRNSDKLHMYEVIVRETYDKKRIEVSTEE